jgi:hypothetical protein
MRSIIRLLYTADGQRCALPLKRRTVTSATATSCMQFLHHQPMLRSSAVCEHSRNTKIFKLTAVSEISDTGADETWQRDTSRGGGGGAGNDAGGAATRPTASGLVLRIPAHQHDGHHLAVFRFVATDTAGTWRTASSTLHQQTPDEKE